MKMATGRFTQLLKVMNYKLRKYLPNDFFGVEYGGTHARSSKTCIPWLLFSLSMWAYIIVMASDE